MAEKNEQAKPLAPTAHRIDVDEHDNIPVEFVSRRREKCIKCCGCSVAVLLIIVVTILILMLTVFHIKGPVLKLNSVKLNGLSGNMDSLRGLNLTLVADLSVKNPNVASFKFDNATTIVYYDGSVVGDGTTPAGWAGARRTVRMNVSVDVMVDKRRRFESDLIAGILGFNTYTRMDGKVKITQVIKRSVVVKMNCSINVNVSTNVVLQDRNCRTSVSM